MPAELQGTRTSRKERKMQLRNKFEKAKWRAGVVKDVASNFIDRLCMGLALEDALADAYKADIVARKAARRANKPA
jgi:hypothetical protein